MRTTYWANSIYFIQWEKLIKVLKMDIFPVQGNYKNLIKSLALASLK